TPYYLAVRPEMTVAEVLAYIRRHGKKSETVNFLYVVDEHHRLIDDLRISQVLFAPETATVASLSDGEFVSLQVTDQQEEAIDIFKQNDRMALPVVTVDHTLVGIVTADDIIDVMEQADT